MSGSVGPISFLNLTGAMGDASLVSNLQGTSLQMRGARDESTGVSGWRFLARTGDTSGHAPESAILLIEQGGETGGQLGFVIDEGGGSQLSIKSVGHEVWRAGDQ